jgi:hypothetical protein
MRSEQRRRWFEASVQVRDPAIVKESAAALATPDEDTFPETSADITAGEMACSRVASEFVADVWMSFIGSYCEST